MVKTGTGFCVNRIRQHVRVRSPTIQSGSSHELEPSKTQNSSEKCEENNAEADRTKGRRVMVVVDSSSEAKNALFWTLSHCVQSQDTLVLLHFVKVKPFKPASDGELADKKRNSRADDSVLRLQNICRQKRPEVEAEVVVVEGDEDKGGRIVEEAKKQGAAMLVMGQKKKKVWVTWHLMLMWAGRPATARNGVVEHCINNAPCMALAVRKNCKKLGGYIITTKRHKDFWLLA